MRKQRPPRAVKPFAVAELLVADVKRQLPRLQKQPAPMHEGTATSFSH